MWPKTGLPGSWITRSKSCLHPLVAALNNPLFQGECFRTVFSYWIKWSMVFSLAQFIFIKCLPQAWKEKGTFIHCWWKDRLLLQYRNVHLGLESLYPGPCFLFLYPWLLMLIFHQVVLLPLVEPSMATKKLIRPTPWIMLSLVSFLLQ